MVEKNGSDPKGYATDYVKGDIERAVFLGNPHIDAMMSTIQAVGAELWSSRRRLYVVEALLEKKIPVTQDSIQRYMPTSQEDARWKADRDRFIDAMYSPMLRTGDIPFGSPLAQSYDPHQAPKTDTLPAVRVGKGK
jgi:hypothetical protein